MQSAVTGVPAIDRLRCEHQVDPCGVDVEHPRLSWQLTEGFPGGRQTAYQLLVADALEHLDGGPLLWDSGRVASGRTRHVAYEGPALPSRATAWWTVRAWSEHDEPTAWAAPARWETGLLVPEDWEAQWISLGPDPGGLRAPTQDWSDLARDTVPTAPLLRRGFTLAGSVRRARLYCTALGLYEAFLNGERVGDGELTPGWTDYDARVQYQVHDVTELLREGDNALAVALADGWYAGYVGFDARRRGAHWGTVPELLAQLEIETDDGQQRVMSDGGWRSLPGPRRCADLLLGETYVAAADPAGWESPGFDDAGWRPVRTRPRDGRALVGERTPPVRVVAELPVAEVLTAPDGAAILDFGQNFSGRVRLRAPAAFAGTIGVAHGEELTPDGDLYVANLRFAQQLDVYQLDRTSTTAGTLEPHFTIHGFRYAKVTGWPGPLHADHASAVVLSSLGKQTGTFECSDALLTKLHENIAWTARGNFVSVPQDDPQRDERLGWLGDAALFAPTACRLFDCASFFSKWLVDVDDARTLEGVFANMAPRVVLHTEGAPGWGDGGVRLPLTLHRAYGDLRALRQAYPAMARWVEHVEEANPDGIWRARRSHDFGDWLVPPGAPVCDKALFSTALHAHSVALLADAAAALGRADDAARWRRMREHVRGAFEREFVDDGRLSDQSQTARVLALAFDLLDGDAAAVALAELVASLEARDWTPATGLHGTAFLCPTLTRHGRADAAYRVVQSRAWPGWLWAVQRGATTIWERWDAVGEDGGFQSSLMNSFNQYALGAVGQWLHETVLGITICETAERPRVRIAPLPGGTLTWARGAAACSAGRIACGWTRAAGELVVELEIPPNVEAVVLLPGEAERELAPGRHVFTVADGEPAAVAAQRR